MWSRNVAYLVMVPKIVWHALGQQGALPEGARASGPVAEICGIDVHLAEHLRLF